MQEFYLIKQVNKIKDLRKIGFFSIFIALFAVVYFFSTDPKTTKRSGIDPISAFLAHKDFPSAKEFLLNSIKSPYTNITYKVERGDSMHKILKKNNVAQSEINGFVSLSKKNKNLKKLQLIEGSVLEITLKQKISKKEKIIEKIIVPISKNVIIEIKKNEENQLEAKKVVTKLIKKISLVENTIKNNLYKAAIDVKMNPNVIVEFARIFGFEIDFQRDIRKNDSFQILYEKFYDDNDEFIKNGSIIYAYMSVNNREISLYKFGKDKDYSYFDINGKSVEKALMKTPINGARLSSPFGMRKHPILGFNKKHTGTDFAAPMGTPIMASGSGTITRAKWCGGGGNCIKIKHNSTYETVYAHMKSFAKGIKVGKKVKQGQIIGYVGSTGMSTGPHLHYEVIVNGKKVNSQTLKLPSGKVLKADERKQFEIARIKTDVLIAEILSKR